jgi:3-deoxy-manno-octulosonate cytidylyltransferase (CMP-KDO synthetase)
VHPKILGVIPARFSSSRFPGKVLAKIAGKSMLQHVFERASLARYIASTIVATDDERVWEAARSFGAPVRMTRPDHISGTDRVAEVASAQGCDVVVNIQADEPLIDPEAIDAAILPVVHDSDIPMCTLKKGIEDPREIEDPNVVKVVTDRSGDAIYFSRCAIPHQPLPHGRGSEKKSEQRPLGSDWQTKAPAPHGGYFKHIGLYVYRRDFLLGYSSLPVGPLERAERLEQLRALENGHRVRVVETDCESLGVDTPEDLERVSRLFEFSIEGVKADG